MKTQRIMFAVVAVVAVAFTTSAHALTLKEKKEWAKVQEDLKNPSHSASGHVKEKCGYELPVKIDEAMLTPFLTAGKSLVGFCDAPRSKIASMCDDKTTKEAVSKQVKSISCHLAKKSDDVILKMSGTTLDVTLGTESSNLEDKVKEFLENNLK